VTTTEVLLHSLQRQRTAQKRAMVELEEAMREIEHAIEVLTMHTMPPMVVRPAEQVTPADVCGDAARAVGFPVPG
jgi:hypothetical protein